jgi:hypothetical protein
MLTMQSLRLRDKSSPSVSWTVAAADPGRAEQLIIDAEDAAGDHQRAQEGIGFDQAYGGDSSHYSDRAVYQTVAGNWMRLPLTLS